MYPTRRQLLKQMTLGGPRHLLPGIRPPGIKGKELVYKNYRAFEFGSWRNPTSAYIP